MKDPKDISFIKVDILENWRFWNAFRIKGDYEGAGREVIAQADAMLAQDTETNERAAMLIQRSVEFRQKKQAAGKAGGEAKAQSREALKTPQTARPGKSETKVKVQAEKPPTLEELYDFCYENDLDADWGRQWYEMTVVDRGFKDRDGNPVKNWKVMCKGFIEKKTTKKEGT